MTQLRTATPARRAAGGNLDVYTALSLGGLFALTACLAMMWIAGGRLASESSQSAMPWQQLPRGR